MPAPPTVTELVGSAEPTCLDRRCVVEHFLGKTQEDARHMYAGGGLHLTEDFTYMASDGLRYYLPPAFDYLCDEESRDDWEFCHGLMCALSGQQLRKLAPDVLALVKAIATYCDGHREKFELEAREDLFDGYLRKIFAA